MTPKQGLAKIQRLITQAQFAIDAAMPSAADKIAISDLQAAKANLVAAAGHVKGAQSRTTNRGAR